MSCVAKPQITLPKALISYLMVALFLFFEMGIQVSPSVMTSQLKHALNISSFGLGLMSGCYFYTYALMQLPSGMLFDRFNPRYIISLSILCCALGCIMFGLASNIYFGGAARMLMGIGSAFAFIAVLVVTADLFVAKYFAFITGITQTLAALGAISGQIPLSYAVMHLGWRHTMFILASVGVILAIFVWITLNYKKDMINLCCDPKPKLNKPTTSVIKILKNKQTWLLALYALLLWAPMSGFASLWGVPFLENVYGLSKHSAALLCSFMWLGLAFASPLLGWLSTALRSRVWSLVLSALLGTIAFSSLLIFHLSPIIAAILIFLSGAACCGQALSFTVIKEMNNKAQQATAIAFNNMAVVASGAIFQPLLGWLLDFHGHNYRMSMIIILAAYMSAALIAILFIKESFQNPSTVPNNLKHSPDLSYR